MYRCRCSSHRPAGQRSHRNAIQHDEIVGTDISLNIDPKPDCVYSERVSQGEYLVIIDGTDAEISQAEPLVNNRGIQNWATFNISSTSILTKKVQPAVPNMIKVELDIAGTQPGERPFEGYKIAQFGSLPRIREYIVLNNLYYEVEKVFYWEGNRPPRLIIRYAGSL